MRTTDTAIHGPLTEGGLLLLAVGLPLTLGASPVTAVVGSALACATTLLLVWHRGSLGLNYYSRKSLRPAKIFESGCGLPAALSVPWFGWVLVALVALTALQNLPLPPAALRLLAPATADVLAVSLAGIVDGPRWHPISLDPSATWREAMKLGAAALTFVAAHNHLRHPERQTRLLLALLGGGCATVLVGFAGALGALGQSSSAEVAPTSGGLIQTAFYNPNHGAAYLVLCTVAGAALCATVQRRFRTLVALAAIWTGVGVFLTLSRGGILALGVGLGALALLLWALSPASRTYRRPAMIVPAATGAIIVGAALLAYERVVAEFWHLDGRLDLSKTAVWSSGLEMARANPWLGVGRGAFLSAFPRYFDPTVFGGEVTMSHLENQYLHLAAEWGLVAAGAAIVLSGVALLGWLLARRRAGKDPGTRITDAGGRLADLSVEGVAAATAAAAGGAGLLSLAVHNLFDYNLELSSIALPAAVLAGAVSAPAPRPGCATTARGSRQRARLATVLPLPLLALLLVATGALTVRGLVRPLTTAEQQLQPALELVRDRAPLSRVRAAVEPLIRARPADYYPHLLLGRAAADHGEREAIGWLNRAMYLYPASPLVHRETAEALWRLGHRRQALIEYRSALAQGARANLLLPAILPRCRDLDDLELLLPPRPALHALAAEELLRARRVDLGLELARSAIARWPEHPEVLAAWIQLLLASQQHQAASDAAQKLVRLSPTPSSYGMWARTAASQPAQQVAILRRARQRLSRDVSLAFALAEAHLAASQPAEAQRVVDELLARVSASPQLAHAHELLARVYQLQGKPHEASWARTEAARLRALP